ncbi:hypothetical protein [Salinarimonas chemoclinalis]|uniref:hypothetical protein n=1 Tax=Salinarimonas chemoclinalis TaxID=3241599 RepID=UPI003555DD54
MSDASIPTAWERKALRILADGMGGVEDAARLVGAGERTRASIIAKGWAEDVTGPLSLGRKLRITPAGREALDRRKPPEPRRTRLKQLPSRVKPLPPRVKPL